MENSPFKENGTWWHRRSRLERRISLCASVAVLVACGFAFNIAVLIYHGQDFYKVSDLTSTAAMTSINNCQVRDSVCNTPECVIAAAELLENMDKKIDPCDDFYSFACAGFEAKTVIPEDESEVDVSSLIQDQVTQQLRFLIERPNKEDDSEPFKIVKNFYKSCLNETQLEELGVEPLKEVLEQFGGWPVVEGDKWNETNFVWYETMYKFQQAGYSHSYLVVFNVEIYQNNSNSRIVELDQTFFDRIFRESLIEGMENEAVKAYLEYQIGLATLLGADEDSARMQQSQVLEFEILLAKICLSDEERYDVNQLYNPMIIKELSKKVPDIPWLEYVNAMLAPHHVLTEDERVNVPVPDYFPKLINLLAKTPKRTLANYFMWKVSFHTAFYLNKAARYLKLKYEVALNKTMEHQSRWEECMKEVKDRLKLAIDAMYVREFFDEDARQSVEEIVDDIRSVFIEMIDEAKWMNNITKIHPKKKVASMTAVIGYTDELRIDKKLIEHYENLTLSSNDFMKNALNLRRYNQQNQFKNLRDPVNTKQDWTSHESSTDVNAYYFNLHNTMELPAGILQGALFGKNRPTYLNYAATGSTVGHEIAHAFSDDRIKLDFEGNEVEWEAPMKNNYMERIQCFIDQYDNCTFPELGLRLNGTSTKKENIADNEGMKAAYRAYIKWASRQRTDSENWDQVEQRLPGLSEYSVRQLFWLAAASSFCQKSQLEPEELESEVLSITHSPNRFRVIGTFVNIPQFASDFN